MAALAGLAQSASAGPGNDYCVIHNFRLTTPGNIPPAVVLKYAQKTRQDQSLQGHGLCPGVGAGRAGRNVSIDLLARA